MGATPAFYSAEISMVKDDKLYVAGPDGSGLRCVAHLGELSADSPGEPRVVWGPAADRLFVSGTVWNEPEPVALDSVDTASAEWTRPTGTSVISITDGGDTLVKSPIGGGTMLDVSFLVRHDDVVYYPSGTHVAVVGENARGEYGIFLATNRGADARQMVITEMAELSSPAFDHFGLSLFWIARVDGVSHVHEIFARDDEEVVQVDLEGSIILESERELSDLLVAPWVDGSPLIALTEGQCGDASGIRTLTQDWNPMPEEFQQFDNTPIGWLPDTHLVVAAYPGGCASGSTDVYVVSWDNVGKPVAELFAAGVEGAAVRSPLPDPPPPPDATFEGFA